MSVALAGGEVGEFPQRSRREPEGHLARLGILHGPEPLEEVLVGVRRVELHDLHLLRTAAEVLGQLHRQVGLPSARWAVEHQLPLVEEEFTHLVQPGAVVYEEFGGECLGDVRQRELPRRQPFGGGVFAAFAAACCRIRTVRKPDERVQGVQDTGQVDDVVLDGQSLLDFLRQLLVRVALREPGDGPAQVGQPARRRGLYGVPGDPPDVQPAVADGGHGVADAHLRQEGVQFVDETPLLVVRGRPLVPVLDEAAQRALRRIGLLQGRQVRGRERDEPLLQP
ncbi:hypothetical protein ACM01_39580 [Streptomyces viridochromogenes]|uniref:Uncharacterized protein n=1 Tax=Streptomyces viridochromogenes TaxID=1938 RepID=A0A0J8BRN4_STRVR|nr:hypothetical protein ACM01_39580 [Streptomyces viridochromogenes]